MSTTMMQQELALDKEIDDRLNELLKQMQKLMDGSRIWESSMEVNQIQNLLAVAMETDSVEVVKNYIRYQIGRDNKSASWRKGVGNRLTFGDQIVDELDRLHGIALSIVPANSAQHFIDRAWMKLTRLYLGHLRRYFYYKKRSKED